MKVWNGFIWMRTNQRKELENNVTKYGFRQRGGRFLDPGVFGRHSELFRSVLNRRSGFVVLSGAGCFGLWVLLFAFCCFFALTFFP